ncbi:hypothetical protein KC850_00870 [Candidatus Kaiserbacteria bacterium]|nr:hypothetical protein [Candidatus Kaiserbacteria bacterium]
MNSITLMQKTASARFFAAITIISMILSAFPVAFFVAQATDTLVGPTDVDVDNTTEFSTGAFDASGYENLILSFDYDAESLDGPGGGGDSFTYGWRSGATDTDINTINGVSEPGTPADETGSVSFPLPVGAQVADLEIYISVTANSSGAADDVNILNLQVTGDLVVVGTVHNVEDDLYFATVQEAIDAPTTGTGETIELTADITTGSQITINKEITLDGNGHTISPTFAKTTNSNNSVITIGSDNVSVTDLVIDGTGGTNLHGINVYRSENVSIVDLTTINVNRTAVLANGSEVDVENITTTGSGGGGWSVMNADQGSNVTEPTVLTVRGVSSHDEPSPLTTPHIKVDNTGKDVTVNDVEGQYDYLFIPFPSISPASQSLVQELQQGPGIGLYTLKVEEPKKVAICHWHQNGFNLIEVSVNSIANAHGNDTEDIIPVIPNIYPNGQNLSADYNGFTGSEILDNNCEPEPVANIHTSKIVCTDEADLPNGSVTKPISATTASDWVEGHSSCELVKGWEFEWGPKNSSDPGDTLVGSAGGDWTTFTGSIAIPESELESHLWVREVLQEDYIPFTHGPEGNKNTDDVTAEMYCHTDAKNYDNYDRLDGPEAENDYYCVAWNVPVEKTSDVTICKYDDQQESLSGWQLSLLGDEVDTLAVKSDGTTQSMLNVPVGEYVLKADGAYRYRGGTVLEADARFSERKAGDPGFGTYPDQPWRVASALTGGLAVQVNGDLGVIWGDTFSPSHVYYGGLSQAVLGNLDFYIYDNVYTDNSGEIDVTLYNGRTGVTGDNGCVTFEDVPYGEYDIEELLQADWENVSGLGPVVVDEESELFTVVNKDLDREPVLCTLKLTSDDTNTVEEKEGAFAVVLDFIHDAWTESLLDADWIWGDQGPTDPSQAETQTFSNKFGWGGATIVDATLTIAADNSFSASINGDLAGEDLTEHNYGATKDYDVAGLIDNGNNELLVEVTNFAGSASRKSNPAGLYYELVITGEGEDCGVPYIPEPEEPEYGPYCGDGEINQLWEQCDGDDVEEGQSCTDYCTLDNQCSAEPLIKITLDETDSTSFDGSIHLDMAGNMIPNGTWFSFGESIGAETMSSIANAVDGLAVKRDTINNKLALAFVGGNSSTHLDIVAGTIMTKGIDLGSVDRAPNPQFKLEDGSGSSFDDVFDKNPDQSIDFDLRADTGNDGVTVVIGEGEEYDCPECKAEVEARIVIRDEDGAEVTNGGLGNLTETVILGDGTEVPFGEWFKISEAANPGDSAEWIDDAETVTNFTNPANLEGLFVSREGNGKVKVALYGYHNPGGDTNYESLRATIEFNDAKVLGGSTTGIPGNFKLENHSETDQVNSNDNFDSFAEAGDLMSVDFDFWVDTKADGITITLDSDEIDSCEDDDDPREPAEPMTHRIEGTKYVVSGDSEYTPYEGWRIYATNGDQDPLSTTTDETGHYYFDVEPGEWTISEEMPEGWSQVQVRQYDYIQLTTDEPLTCDFLISDYEFVKYLRISEFIQDDSEEEYQDESSGYECDFYNELDEEEDNGGPDEEEEVVRRSYSSGTRIGGGLAPRVLGASTDSCPFLVEYMQIGATNNPVEVTKLQLFLNVFKDMFGGTENPVTGVFGQTTDANVKAFQEHFRAEILDPWFERGIVPHNRPTGFVYKTTLWKINSIVCPDYAVLPNFEGEDLSTNVDIDSN